MKQLRDTLRRGGGPWFWIPTLYFAEGLPYALVATVSVCFTKTSACRTRPWRFTPAWLYLPWVIKPLWSPVVDLSKRGGSGSGRCNCSSGAGLAGVALTIPAPHFFQWTLVFFWLLAFSSATHDIAADGFYMLATTEREQSFFIGFRSMFYHVAKICAQGGLVILAGRIAQAHRQLRRSAWSMAFALAAGIFLALGVYHRFILPHPATDEPARPPGETGKFLDRIF